MSDCFSVCTLELISNPAASSTLIPTPIVIALATSTVHSISRATYLCPDIFVVLAAGTGVSQNQMGDTFRCARPQPAAKRGRRSRAAPTHRQRTARTVSRIPNDANAIQVTSCVCVCVCMFVTQLSIFYTFTHARSLLYCCGTLRGCINDMPACTYICPHPKRMTLTIDTHRVERLRTVVALPGRILSNWSMTPNHHTQICELEKIKQNETRSNHLYFAHAISWIVQAHIQSKACSKHSSYLATIKKHPPHIAAIS